MRQGFEMDQNQPILQCLHSSFPPKTSPAQTRQVGPKNTAIYGDYIPEFWGRLRSKKKQKNVVSKSVWQRAYECLTTCVNLLADCLQKFLRINISTRRKGNINASTHRNEDISPNRNGITIFVTLVPSCRIRLFIRIIYAWKRQAYHLKTVQLSTRSIVIAWIDGTSRESYKF